MTTPVLPPGATLAPTPRRVLVSWERGSGGPVVTAAGTLGLTPGSGTYPRNGYLDLYAEWPDRRRYSILNRRVVEVVDLGQDEEPAAVAKELASRGDLRWP